MSSLFAASALTVLGALLLPRLFDATGARRKL